MRIVTCNVRYAGAKDGDNGWEYRKAFCLSVIREQNADVICCQEPEAGQVSFLRSGLAEYEWFGMADEPHSADVVNSIFYRRSAFRLVSAGGYWLSETPHVAGSSSWDSRCIRLCNWVRLIELRSQRELRVVNTHLDHISQPARENQARLINEDSAAYGDDYAQLLTGDMNCCAGNAAIQAFQKAGWVDTYAALHGVDNPLNTYHGFLGPAYQGGDGKIDWIFARGRLQIAESSIITSALNGRYPSDHYFLSADVGLSAP